MWTDLRGSEVIERPECLRLVAVAAREHFIGRLGIGTEGGPIVVPVNFTYNDGDLLIRIGAGTLAREAPGTLVAFEVDHLEGERRQAWSVLVRGLAQSLSEGEFHRLWRQVPEPLVPTPGDVLLSVRPDVVTGRRFSLAPPTVDTSAIDRLRV